MRHYGEKPKIGLTGAIAEVELFGEIGQKIKIDFRKWQARQEELYLPKKTALQVVKENQPGDPKDPDPQFANDVYEKFVALLVLGDPRQKDGTQKYHDAVDSVDFFTAVHSTLDYAHRVDAFFEIHIDKNHFVRVELDASIYNKDSCDADVFVEYPPEGLDPREDKSEWENLVAATAEAILETLTIKLKRHDIERR